MEVSLSPFKTGNDALVLTAVLDITERKRIEKALQDLSGENAMLLRELQHRIANSLQIVVSILSLRA